MTDGQSIVYIICNMARIVKSKEERRLEIIITARELFNNKGYEQTSVDDITNHMGVAKGTYYYYFESKKDVLKAIVDYELNEIIQTAEKIADDKSLDAMTKMKMLLSGSSLTGENAQEIKEHLHLPGNRELHEITNIETVLRLSPVFVKIIEQGNSEKIFNVDKPLETIQFLITGAQFLTDSGLFNFNKKEIKERQIVIQEIVEKVLGAEKGAFGFMNPNIKRGEKNEKTN